MPGLDFSIDDLYLAYRKAKVDVFWQKSLSAAEQFCVYEEDLAKNIKKLHAKITSASADWSGDSQFIGSVGFIPKELELVEQPPEAPHFFHSDLEERWKHLTRDSEKKPRLILRPIADFTVDMHIVSALWINSVGHKFDECLGRECYGNRVRRLRARNSGRSRLGKYHVDATGTFVHYASSLRC